MDKFFKNMRGIIALSVVFLAFAFLFLLAVLAVPAQNKDVLVLSAGSVLTMLSGITGYYFGSSKDKSDQDKANNPNMQTGATVDTKTTIEASKPPEKTV